MKSSIDKTKVKNLLKHYSTSKRGWSLCIGAGTSYGIFPDWSQLVELLMQKVDNLDNTKLVLHELKSKFSLDALIQASFEKMNISEEEFSKVLSDLLYSSIKSKLSKNEFSSFVKVLSTTGLDKINKKYWKEFVEIRERHFTGTTAYALAKVISGVIRTELRPSEIMTFNAEPILFSLINSYIFEKNIDNVGKMNSSISKDVYLVNRSISPLRKEAIPYFFIHGFLPIPESENNKLFPTDKLVFSEIEYLELANNSYSWQSSVFLNICSSRPVVFIGVSLSDPNSVTRPYF